MASGYDAPNALVKERNRWHELRHSNSSHARAKQNARAHYGLGVAFCRLWLDDPLMMYTCAYWLAETKSLEEIQVNKIEHVCRKLLLRGRAMLSSSASMSSAMAGAKLRQLADPCHRDGITGKGAPDDSGNGPASREKSYLGQCLATELVAAHGAMSARHDRMHVRLRIWKSPINGQCCVRQLDGTSGVGALTRINEVSSQHVLA